MDVYDGTPTIVTTYLTIIPKISILILLLELQLLPAASSASASPTQTPEVINTNLSNGYLTIVDSMPMLSTDSLVLINNTVSSLFDLPVLKTLLLISSILSLIIGSLLGLAQIRIKRLLA